MGLQFRILGPLEVVDGDRALPLAGAKQRALLAILLLNANEPVSVDRLSEALWGAEPPSTTVKMIQGYVSQLRKVLGEGVLVTRAPGYLVRVGVDELDASRFERLVAEADGRPPDEAGALLDAALGLWHGPPLADFRYEAFAQTEIARLEGARLAALEDRIDVDLARGRHAGLVSEVEALVALHPFRERLLAQLMLALYGSGRQADALAVYRDARQALFRELGLDPSPALRELERQILVHDPALQAPARRPAIPPRLVRQGRKMVIAGALIVVAAATAVGWELAGGSGGHSPAGSAVVVINSGSSRIVGHIPSGQVATSLTLGAGSLWALSTGGGTVSRIDSKTRKVVATYRTPGLPTDIAVGDGALWVLNGRTSGGGTLVGGVEPVSVSRLDARSAVATRTTELPVGSQPGYFDRVSGIGAIAIGPDAVWAIDGSGDVARINPSTGDVVAVVKGVAAQAIAVSGNDVWVDDGETTVARINPQTNRISTRISLTASALDGIALGAGAVWVADAQDGTVWRISPGTPVVTRTITVGIGVLSLSFGSGAVWAVNPFLGTVSRIDPATDIVHAVAVGGTPQAVAVGGGAVWASVTADLKGPQEAGVQTLPASACSTLVSGSGRVRFLIASDLPLHGPSSIATVPMTRAIAYALERHGFRAGKYTVGYQSCDDSTAQAGGFDFAACGANARAYAADPSVLGVIGTYNSQCAIGELPITNETPTGPLAMISPLDTDPDLTHRARGFTPGLLGLLYPTGQRNFVRIVAPDDVEAAGDAKLARDLNLTSVFVLDDGTQYGRNLTGGFANAAHKLGLKLAGVSPWDTTAKSDAALVDRIRRSGADGVFFAGYRDTGAGELLRELRSRFGRRLKLIAPDSFLPIPELTQQAGAATTGMYVSFAGRPDERLPAAGRSFINAFASTQPSARVTSYSAAYSAQAAEALLTAIGRSNGTRASVTKQLFASRVTGGILGSFGFTRDGDMTPSPVTIFRIVGGDRPSSTHEQDFVGSVIDRVIDVPASLATSR